MGANFAAMIHAIPNQPIDLTGTLPAEGCCTDQQPPSHIGDKDYIHFQVDTSFCPGWTPLHDGVMQGVVTTGNGWAYTIDGCLYFGTGDEGATATVPGFTPVVGGHYVVILDFDRLDGSAEVCMGGVCSLVSGPGQAMLSITAQTADPLVITVGGAGGRLPRLRLCGLRIYANPMDYTLIVGEDEYDYATYPTFFSLDGSALTVMAPMEAMGLDVGDCITIGLRDDCDEETLTSQPFEVVDSADCKYLQVRLCNDGAALGFTGGFIPRTRVPGMLAWVEYEYERRTERDNNGRIRTTYGDRQSVYRLRVSEINSSDHAFLSLAPIAHHVYIGGREVVVDVDQYQPIYGDVRHYMGGVDLTVRPKEEMVRNILCEAEGDGCSSKEDPICPEPDIAFSMNWPMLSVEIFSADGFSPCTFLAEQPDGQTHGVSYAGPIPSGKINIGNFTGIMPIKVSVTDCGPMACMYFTQVIPVPPEMDCDTPGSLSLTVGQDVMVDLSTSTGWFTAKDHHGDLLVFAVGSYPTLPAGSYCIYPSDDQGEQAGTASLVTLIGDDTGTATLDITRMDAGEAFMIISLPITDLDTTCTTPREMFISGSKIKVLDLSGYVSAPNTAWGGTQFGPMSLLEKVIFDPSKVYTDVQVYSSPQLSEITGLAELRRTYSPIQYSGNALPAAAVNMILAACVQAGSTYWGAGVLFLDGGTSAAPTGQGITDKSTLQGWGATVVTN